MNILEDNFFFAFELIRTSSLQLYDLKYYSFYHLSGTGPITCPLNPHVTADGQRYFHF
jgi:hypothetical protein